MTANKERMFWYTNSEWYRLNSNKEIELTEKAPKEAIESFEKWKNNKK